MAEFARETMVPRTQVAYSLLGNSEYLATVHALLVNLGGPFILPAAAHSFCCLSAIAVVDSKEQVA